MSGLLDGCAVLVTGGGTGIGRATALAFARAGAAVAVNYSKSRAEAESAATECGATAIAVQADVADEAAVRAMMDAIEKKFGRLDFLVNNAGWSTRVPHGEMDALTDDIWQRTLDTNLRGVFYCVRAARKLLEASPRGAIVNIASVAGLTGSGSSMVYAASKGAVLTMTKSLARALAPCVRVNAVAPGLIRTRFANWPDEAFERTEAITPLARLATVDDVAAAALFLCVNPAVTGETLVVDGGISALGPRETMR